MRVDLAPSTQFNVRRRRPWNPNTGYATDYAHVYRNLPKKCFYKARAAKFSNQYFETMVTNLHLCETVAKFDALAHVYLEDLRKSNETAVVAYLTTPGSGYLVPPFKAWNITALWKYDAEGHIRMASSPPSSQHGERYNKKMGSDVLCGRRCSRQHLIEIVIPQLLLIDGHRFGNLSFIPPNTYPSQCAAASARLFDLYPSGS